MRGFVPTPPQVVDTMTARLFRGVALSPEHTFLDPGCGDGSFIEGLIRWFTTQHRPLPRIVGIEADESLAHRARQRFSQHPAVQIRTADFLGGMAELFDFIIGNPPYVSITQLPSSERAFHRKRFTTAQGRFDLYLLFFEQGLRQLKPGGRLAFITPEKFLYTATAGPLRKILSALQIDEIRLVAENTFPGLVTYPTITMLTKTRRHSPSLLIGRDGQQRRALLSTGGESWQPAFHGESADEDGVTLEDVAARVSCGIATGADGVFVHKTRDLERSLRPFAYPTIAGRELDTGRDSYEVTCSILVPYAKSGELLPERQLGALGTFLRDRRRHEQLLRRTCVARKPWYAFHDNAPLTEILQPKILCKDIAASPRFWADRSGILVPRHSVYYIVPREPGRIDELLSYLNSETSRVWLRSHCQRATNGFLRLQSHVLKRLPVPTALASRISPLRGRRRAANAISSDQLDLPLRPTNAHAI